MENVQNEKDIAPAKEMSQEEYEKQMDILHRIEKTLNKIRPYIQADGGDVQLVDFQDGEVIVSMLGACAGCMAIDMTLNDGIQAILMDEVPEVKSVRMLQTTPSGYY